MRRERLRLGQRAHAPGWLPGSPVRLTSPARARPRRRSGARRRARRRRPPRRPAASPSAGRTRQLGTPARLGRREEQREPSAGSRRDAEGHVRGGDQGQRPQRRVDDRAAGPRSWRPARRSPGGRPGEAGEAEREHGRRRPAPAGRGPGRPSTGAPPRPGGAGRATTATTAKAASVAATYASSERAGARRGPCGRLAAPASGQQHPAGLRDRRPGEQPDGDPLAAGRRGCRR